MKMNEKKLLDYALEGVKQALEINEEWLNKYPEDERLKAVRKQFLNDYEDILLRYYEVK